MANLVNIKSVEVVTEYTRAEVIVGAKVYFSVKDARTLLDLTSRVNSITTHDALDKANTPACDEAREAYKNLSMIMRAMAKGILVNAGDKTKPSEMFSRFDGAANEVVNKTAINVVNAE